VKNKDKLFDDKFLLGVNYWPRHKAVRMWKDWAPKEIASEFAEMKALSLNCARVFTVWDDFQPLL
jgi:endo-1,4-beta-mannosidase